MVLSKKVELLSRLRFSEGCKALFNKNALCDLGIFSKIHRWLQNHDYKQNLETQINTRMPIKVQFTVALHEWLNDQLQSALSKCIERATAKQSSAAICQ